MPSWNNPTGRTRRELMAILGIAGAASVAGCIGDDDDPGVTPTPTPDDDDDDDDTTTTPDQPDREVMGTYRNTTSSDAPDTILFHIADTTSGAYTGLVLDGAYAVTDDRHDDAIFPLWLDINLAEGSDTVYECELRDNLHWSDPYGQMTAEDWVWYIQEIHQAEDNWAGSIDADRWGPLDVERTGDLTFEIDIHSVNPDWPWEPTMWGSQIMPKAALEDYADDRDLDGIITDASLIELQYAGNLGPYRLERWERDSVWQTVRNEDYYLAELDAADFPDYLSDDEIEAFQGAPWFEGYEFNVIPEESTRLSALRTGEVDQAAIPEGRVEEFQVAVDDVYVVLAPQPYIRVMSYGMRTSGWEALSNLDPDYDGQGITGYGHEDAREIRWALAAALDKDFISDEIENGLSNPAQTFQPRWSRWYNEEEVHPVGQGDTFGVDLARDHLEQHLPDGYGYDNGDLIAPEGHDRWDGDQVELTWVHTAGIETYDLTAEYVMGQWQELGIELDINTVLWETLLGRWLANQPIEGVDETVWSGGAFNAGHPHETANVEQWDILYGINFNTYPRTPPAGEVFWVNAGSVNYYGYVEPTDMGPNNDKTMAEMWADARAETDEDARLDILGEIFGQLSYDLPNNFVTMGVSETGFQNRVVGPEERFGYGWNSPTWHFDPGLI